MKRRMYPIMFATACSVLCLNQIYGQSPESIEAIEEAGKVETIINTELEDADTLLMNYLEKELLGQSRISFYAGDSAGKYLKGKDAIVYQYVKEALYNIANGTETSTIVKIPINLLIDSDHAYSAAELGVDAIVKDGYITQEAVDKLSEIIDFDYSAVNHALVADCAFELFWYDKTQGIYLSYPGITATYDRDLREYCLKFSEKTPDIQMKFVVSGDYASDTYVLDSSKLNRVQTSIKNARQIVTDAAAFSDLNKLYAYRDRLCELTSYNYEAAETSHYPYGDPWQIIHMFDGDPDTKVVCEGYSKSFQYLCEMTDFSSPDIYCFSVTGNMGKNRNPYGPHMWNLLHMENGETYLVDVTNYDSDEGFYRDGLFIGIPESGTAEDQYFISDLYYKYDPETLAIYDLEELTLSDEIYTERKEITLTYLDGVLTAEVLRSDTAEYGILSASEDDVTLETAERKRIAFTEADAQHRFIYETKEPGYYRAYVTYIENGESKTLYSGSIYLE